MKHAIELVAGDSARACLSKFTVVAVARSQDLWSRYIFFFAYSLVTRRVIRRLLGPENRASCNCRRRKLDFFSRIEESMIILLTGFSS